MQKCRLVDGKIINLYSIQEIVNFENVTKKEVDECKYYSEKDGVAGFSESVRFNASNPEFIQIYSYEIASILDEKSDNVIDMEEYKLKSLSKKRLDGLRYMLGVDLDGKSGEEQFAILNAVVLVAKDLIRELEGK